MPRKKFKQYNNSANRSESGKGSDRREAQISEEQVGENWCKALGHRFRFGACTNCGLSATLEDITANIPL
jgi:hypothetical protein